MAFLEIQNVKLSGLSACVPKTILENKDYPGFTSSEEAEKFMTQIARRKSAVFTKKLRQYKFGNNTPYDDYRIKKTA